MHLRLVRHRSPPAMPRNRKNSSHWACAFRSSWHGENWQREKMLADSLPPHTPSNIQYRSDIKKIVYVVSPERETERGKEVRAKKKWEKVSSTSAHPWTRWRIGDELAHFVANWRWLTNWGWFIKWKAGKRPSLDHRCRSLQPRDEASSFHSSMESDNDVTSRFSPLIL